MILRYTGKEPETIPLLAHTRYHPGDIVDVRNERIAKALLKTLRWEKASRVPKPEAKREEPIIEVPVATLRRSKSKEIKGVDNE